MDRGLQQESAIGWRWLVVELDDVLLILTHAVDQLAPWPRALLAGELDPCWIADTLVPDQLVDGAEHAPDRPASGRAESDGEIAADAEAGYWGAGSKQVGDAELIDVAADEHIGLAKTGLVQNPSHVLAVGEEVAAVEADRDHFMAQTRLRIKGNRDGGFDSSVHVIGIEENRIAIQGLGHRVEGILLGREELHQGMGNGAASGESEDFGPRDKGGAGATADKGRTSRKIGIVGSAKPEVGDLPAGRRIDQAGRFRRDQRRHADGPQQT